MPVDHQNDEIVFSWDEVSDGRQIVLRFEIASRQTLVKLPLPSSVIPESITIDASPETDECTAGVVIADESVSFPCAPEILQKATIKYKYVDALVNSFTVPGTIPEDAKWTIYINQIKTKNYTRQDATITIPAETLTSASKVRVEIEIPDNS